MFVYVCKYRKEMELGRQCRELRGASRANACLFKHLAVNPFTSTFEETLIRVKGPSLSERCAHPGGSITPGYTYASQVARHCSGSSLLNDINKLMSLYFVVSIK